MAEQVAVFLVGIRIVAVRVVFCNQVQKAPNITFVDKIAHLCSSWHGLMVVLDIPGPDTEKLPEIERLILQLHIAFIGEDFTQVVGIDFQLWQLVICCLLYTSCEASVNSFICGLATASIPIKPHTRRPAELVIVLQLSLIHICGIGAADCRCRMPYPERQYPYD